MTYSQAQEQVRLSVLKQRRRIKFVFRFQNCNGNHANGLLYEHSTNNIVQTFFFAEGR